MSRAEAWKTILLYSKSTYSKSRWVSVSTKGARVFLQALTNILKSKNPTVLDALKRPNTSRRQFADLNGFLASLWPQVCEDVLNIYIGFRFPNTVDYSTWKVEFRFAGLNGFPASL